MCFWPWSHKWSKWEIAGEGRLMQLYDHFTGRKLGDDELKVTGRFVDQSRQCEMCGKIQLRKVKA